MVKELVGKPHAGSFFSGFPREQVGRGGDRSGPERPDHGGPPPSRPRVCLVERRYEIGGGLATEEILFRAYSNIHAPATT
jgi:hypothetical protein